MFRFCLLHHSNHERQQSPDTGFLMSDLVELVVPGCQSAYKGRGVTMQDGGPDSEKNGRDVVLMHAKVFTVVILHPQQGLRNVLASDDHYTTIQQQ